MGYEGRKILTEGLDFWYIKGVFIRSDLQQVRVNSIKKPGWKVDWREACGIAPDLRGRYKKRLSGKK